MVLDELYAGCEVSLVELVGDIPPQGAELASLLHGGVKEGHGKEQGLPLRHGAVVQLLLSEAHIGPLQPSPHPLGGLVGELDGELFEGKNDNSTTVKSILIVVEVFGGK